MDSVESNQIKVFTLYMIHTLTLTHTYLSVIVEEPNRPESLSPQPKCSPQRQRVAQKATCPLPESVNKLFSSILVLRSWYNFMKV